MEVELLKQTALNFVVLLDKKITIELGRKGQKTVIDIVFTKDHFFHLAGLHKLKDIQFRHKKSALNFDDILKGKLRQRIIENSVFYKSKEIKSRLEVLSSLYKGFTRPRLVVRKAKNFPIKGSELRWVYLIEFYVNDVRLGYFFIEEYRESKVNEYIGTSVFEKTSRDYTVNQTKYTILSIYETDKKTGNRKVLFKK